MGSTTTTPSGHRQVDRVLPSENRGPDCLDTPWLLLRVPSHSSLSIRLPVSSLTGAVGLTGPWPPPGRVSGSRTRAACACARSAQRGAWQGTTTGRAQTESPLTREAGAGLFPLRAPGRRRGPASPALLAPRAHLVVSLSTGRGLLLLAGWRGLGVQVLPEGCRPHEAQEPAEHYQLRGREAVTSGGSCPGCLADIGG